MVILNKPRNLDDYICVNSSVSKELHKLGYQPIFRDGGNIYYPKNEEIRTVIKNVENAM